ncbi:hypothetical protein Pcinc_008845 [Petrolisthes cinctipes]|uniref:F5/8 type C domain-containing protein n=1 Tax=Petrolisthes cinctipes TaxID=88211 RepID=A0AAE1KZ52_PETCI|nr:hypothetical protein Pcinc_008845 [Petrolisthes cinctipes]
MVLWCSRWVTAVVVVVLLMPPSPVEGGELQLWRDVLISHSRMTMTYDTMQLGNPSIPAGAITNLYCSSSCLRMGWCNVWCSYPSTTPTHCILSNAIAMPNYMEPNMADVITCHTKQLQDKATNAIITAGAQAAWFPQKGKENLVDGIYTYHGDENYSSATGFTENWFLIDFSEIIKISQVFLFAPISDYAHQVFYDLEVRVGNVTVTSKAELAAYDLFGAFPGEAYPGQVVDLMSAVPVSCRFLAVQKMTIDWFEFEVAHIEVY